MCCASPGSRRSPARTRRSRASGPRGSEMPGGHGSGVADLVRAHHPLDLVAREAAGDRGPARCARAPRSPSVEARGAPDVDVLVADPVGEVEPAEAAPAGRARRPVSSASSRAPGPRRPAAGRPPTRPAGTPRSARRPGSGTARRARRRRPRAATISADGGFSIQPYRPGRPVGQLGDGPRGPASSGSRRRRGSKWLARRAA